MSINFHVYKDAKNEWRWRLITPNSNVIADSGEGYVNGSDCLAAIDEIQTGAASSGVWNATTNPVTFIRFGPAAPKP
jgi:uncharacterized protein